MIVCSMASSPLRCLVRMSRIGFSCFSIDMAAAWASANSARLYCSLVSGVVVAESISFRSNDRRPRRGRMYILQRLVPYFALYSALVALTIAAGVCSSYMNSHAIGQFSVGWIVILLPVASRSIL